MVKFEHKKNVESNHSLQLICILREAKSFSLRMQSTAPSEMSQGTCAMALSSVDPKRA